MIGRRVVPNIHSKELFQKINFFKYVEEKQGSWSRLGSSSKVTDTQDKDLSHEQWNAKYTSNRIKTTRYTWWSFIPHSMFI